MRYLLQKNWVSVVIRCAEQKRVVDCHFKISVHLFVIISNDDDDCGDDDDDDDDAEEKQEEEARRSKMTNSVL